jgi:hypothetical protein
MSIRGGFIAGPFSTFISLYSHQFQKQWLAQHVEPFGPISAHNHDVGIVLREGFIDEFEAGLAALALNPISAQPHVAGEVLAKLILISTRSKDPVCGDACRTRGSDDLAFKLCAALFVPPIHLRASSRAAWRSSGPTSPAVAARISETCTGVGCLIPLTQ